MPPFHLAFPVHDLEKARGFYGGLLGCPEGRSSDAWIDFNLFGHQIVAHLDPSKATGVNHSNDVDGKNVPIPHFGVLLKRQQWDELAKRLNDANTDFVIAPYVRWEGEPQEQATMFMLDPSGNALEFKSFKDASKIFA